MAITNGKHPPTPINKVLAKLSIMAQKLEEIRPSAARVGAITTLSRAKAGQVELHLKEMATGCPGLKEDGSPFDHGFCEMRKGDASIGVQTGRRD